MIIDIKKEVAEGQYKEYHIAIETLIKFEVQCIKDDKDEIIIRYPLGNGNYKECRPRSSASNKWRTLKLNKTPNLPFGYNQLPQKGCMVVITGGEKDVLAFDMLGIPAVCMQSETANIPLDLIDELKKRFSNVMICYDLDETGIKFSQKWEKLYGLPRIVLPEDLDGKDIYDFMTSGRTRIELMELFNFAIMNQKKNKVNQKMDKTYFTGKEVLELKNTKEYIIEGILPKSTLAGLIGGSDTGKSLFLLQFAISYILNKQFLGFDINGGKKVLYFTFEDDPYSLNNRLRKLLNNVSLEERKKVCENLFFECDPEGMEQKIHSHLENHPDTGVIIIDPLAEVLNGTDINSPSSVRESMHYLKIVATQYDLASLFIHHVSKTSEDSRQLNKSNSLGSQAIEAKSRLMIEMKKKSNALNSFIEIGIVKGNDVEERYKAPKKSLNLELNQSTLWYNIMESQRPLFDETKKKEIDWKNIFGQNPELKTKEILAALDRQEQDLTQRQKENLISEQLSVFRTSRGIYNNPFLQKETVNAGASL